MGVLMEAAIAKPRVESGGPRRLVRLEPCRRSYVGRMAPKISVTCSFVRKALDALLLHRLADATARRFLSEIAAGLAGAASRESEAPPSLRSTGPLASGRDMPCHAL